MRKTVVSVLALALVAGFSVFAAQSAAPTEGSHGPAIGGYCPVAYQAMNRAVKGDEAHASTYMGQTFHFFNAEAKGMFDAAPAKFVPAYEGYCATAVAQGMKLVSDPTLFTLHEGAAYLFSSAEAKAVFDKDIAATIAKANENWPKVKAAK